VTGRRKIVQESRAGGKKKEKKPKFRREKGGRPGGRAFYKTQGKGKRLHWEQISFMSSGEGFPSRGTYTERGGDSHHQQGS